MLYYSNLPLSGKKEKHIEMQTAYVRRKIQDSRLLEGSLESEYAYFNMSGYQFAKYIFCI